MQPYHDQYTSWEVDYPIMEPLLARIPVRTKEGKVKLIPACSLDETKEDKTSLTRLRIQLYQEARKLYANFMYSDLDCKALYDDWFSVMEGKTAEDVPIEE